MFEFGARILLAGAVVLFAGATGLVGLPLAAIVAVAVAGLALLAHALDARGLYEGAGAGLHAGLEGLAVALLLAGAGQAERLGFLALVPYAWVAVRRGAPWGVGAFAAAFALVGANALVNRSEPGAGLILQAAGVLGLGLLLSLGLPTPPEPAIVVPSEDLELKRRFRALREAYAVLERRSNEDSHAVALVGASTPEAMAQSVRDATSAAGAVLYVPSESGWERFGSAGHVPEAMEGPFANGRALQDVGAVLLFSNGRPVGAAWLPEEARDGLAGVAEVLSGRLADRVEAETERRRRQAAEVRLTLVEGGDSPDAVARALAALVGADSVEFGVVGPSGATPLGRFGPPCALTGALLHETGPGLDGWAAAGTPLVWIADARQDPRLDDAKALRARAAALALVPLAEGRAYVWAAWHSHGVGRPGALATIRASEAVVLRWIERATGRSYAAPGNRIPARV